MQTNDDILKINVQNLAEVLFISYFSQWKPQNEYWTKEFVSHESYFLKNFKNRLLEIEQIVFKKWPFLILRCVQIHDWWFTGIKPNKFKILDKFSVIHVAMATI